VAPIDEKMRKNRFRGFCDVKRRAINAQVRKSGSIQVEEMKKDEEDKKK
jgi:hypothetical protein